MLYFLYLADGYYMYIETSWPRVSNDTAILQSPKMKSDGHKRCFEFYYHMNGWHMGELYVFLWTPSAGHVMKFHRRGNQGNKWHKAFFELNIATGQDFQVLKQ